MRRTGDCEAWLAFFLTGCSSMSNIFPSSTKESIRRDVGYAANLKPYPDYKPSAVEWLGDVADVTPGKIDHLANNA